MIASVQVDKSPRALLKMQSFITLTSIYNQLALAFCAAAPPPKTFLR